MSAQLEPLIPGWGNESWMRFGKRLGEEGVDANLSAWMHGMELIEMGNAARTGFCNDDVRMKQRTAGIICLKLYLGIQTLKSSEYRYESAHSLSLLYSFSLFRKAQWLGE